MKLNPLQWNEVTPNEEIQAPSGVLQLRGTAPFAVVLAAHGVQTCQFVAAQAVISLPEASTFKVILSDPAGMVFLKDTPSRVVTMTGEKFTNIDRLPQESGTMLEVTRALRMLKLEERAMIRRIREERDAAESVIEKAKPKAEAKAKPKAEAVPEPQPAPDLEPPL